MWPLCHNSFSYYRLCKIHPCSSMPVLHSALWLNHSPLSGQTTFCCSVHQLDILLFPLFGYCEWSCCKQLCTSFPGDMFSVLLGRSLGVGLFYHRARPCLSFWGTTQLSFKAAAPFHIGPVMWEGCSFCFSVSPQHLLLPVFVFIAILVGGKWHLMWFGFAVL